MNRAVAITILRRQHVVAALKYAGTVGAMKQSLVAARLGGLAPTTEWIHHVPRTAPLPTAPPPPPVLEGRVMPPTKATRIHKYVRVSPSATTQRVEHMDTYTVDVYVRMSKGAIEAQTPHGSQRVTRWQKLCTVRDTQWWRVDRFLKQKSTRKLDADLLYIRLWEALNERAYPANTALAQYLKGRSL